MAKFSGPKLNFRYFDESRVEVIGKDVINHHWILVSWGNQKREFNGKTEAVRDDIRAWADSTLQKGPKGCYR
jgi:hypothetical protein